MRRRTLSGVLLILMTLAPAAAPAAIYMVWMPSCTITKITAFESSLELSNVFDPSQYVLYNEGLDGEIYNCACPSLPVVFFEAQLNYFFSNQDGDADSILVCNDNCPAHPNPGQENQDGDGAGDACESPSCVDDPSCVPVELIHFTVQ